MSEINLTERYGLIGHPLGHSFSATYFTEKFQREGRQAEYLNYDLESITAFPSVLQENPTLRGFNVTIPYKEAIIPYLDALHPDAEAMRAVNVVKVSREGERISLKGFNTDHIGFINALMPHLSSHKAALVLGTGGASKAVCYALKKQGINVTLVSRTASEGRITYSDLTPDVMAHHTLIVNATPIGMYPRVDACPPIPYETLTPQHFLYDLVYNPEETLFLQRGKMQGCSTLNGLPMLYGQAEAAWEIWQSE